MLTRPPTGAIGDVRRTGTRVDPVFGSNAKLPALAELYASPVRPCVDQSQGVQSENAAAWPSGRPSVSVTFQTVARRMQKRRPDLAMRTPE
jgi:hypothetical protein